MPALSLDVALIHVNRADQHGNGQLLGPDPFFDDLFCMAAKRRFMSAERIVPTAELLGEHGLASLRIQRMLVDGVIEAPFGAHFTECPPDYGRDEAFQRAYAAAANEPEAWRAFAAEYLSLDEAGYRARTRSS
jgi:glutaconate CoA-transferase subunit A